MLPERRRRVAQPRVDAGEAERHRRDLVIARDRMVLDLEQARGGAAAGCGRRRVTGSTTAAGTPAVARSSATSSASRSRSPRRRAPRRCGRGRRGGPRRSRAPGRGPTPGRRARGAQRGPLVVGRDRERDPPVVAGAAVDALGRGVRARGSPSRVEHRRRWSQYSITCSAAALSAASTITDSTSRPLAGSVALVERRAASRATACMPASGSHAPRTSIGGPSGSRSATPCR